MARIAPDRPAAATGVVPAPESLRRERGRPAGRVQHVKARTQIPLQRPRLTVTRIARSGPSLARVSLYIAKPPRLLAVRPAASSLPSGNDYSLIYMITEEKLLVFPQGLHELGLRLL
jgi:hypothetical protein